MLFRVHNEVDRIAKLATTQILPQITVASFDGSALDWVNFIVQFKEIIHDHPRLSGPQHVIYLLQSLSGEAKQSYSWFCSWLAWLCFWLECLKLLFGQDSYIIY